MSTVSTRNETNVLMVIQLDAVLSTLHAVTHYVNNPTLVPPELGNVLSLAMIAI